MPPPKRILIVDDEAMIRKAIHLALEKEGYEVVEAETGAEALRRIELNRSSSSAPKPKRSTSWSGWKSVRTTTSPSPSARASCWLESRPICERRVRKRKPSTRAAWNSRIWSSISTSAASSTIPVRCC
ncbi:MAG: response regulator [Chloroflexi bacterium]|nr:MAG: response regulator [Chloroflexota bacterium]